MPPAVSVSGRLARFSLALSCVVAAAGATGTGLRAQTVTMRFAHSLPEATYVVQSTKYWIDLVDKRSGGKLKIKLYPGGSLIRLTEAFDALSLNTVQFSDMANSYATPKVKDLAPLDLPGAFPSKRILETHDAVYGVMNEILNKQDVAYLFAYDLGPNTIDLRAGSAIKAPQELQGKVIRDAGSWSGKVLRAWSATPKTVPIGDVVPSIQRGGLDGVMIGVSGLGGLKLHESLPHITVFPNANQVYYYVAASNAQLQKLSKADRELLIQAGRDAMIHDMKAQADFTKSYFARLQKANFDVHWLTPAEEASFQTGIDEVMKQVVADVGPLGKKLSETLEALKK